MHTFWQVVSIFEVVIGRVGSRAMARLRDANGRLTENGVARPENETSTNVQLGSSTWSCDCLYGD